MSNDGTYGGYKPTPLDRAIDKAIAQVNADFLNDEEAQRQAREDGERWRHIMDAEKAAGPYAVVLPLATAEAVLKALRGESVEPIPRETLVAMFQQRVGEAKAR